MKRHVAEPETDVTGVQDLRAFCRVVDLESITAAAQALGETKGAVSRRITRLEQALGVALLRRSPRLVQATEEGRMYRERVGHVLELLDEANQQLVDASANPHGHLRITAPTDVALSVLAEHVAGFTAGHPEITVDLVLTEALLDFDTHRIDVAFRAGAALRDSALVAHRLTSANGQLFASREYLARHGALRVPEDLASHRVLLVHAHRGRPTLRLHHDDGEAPVDVALRPTVFASDFAFTKEVALAGGGIALLPSLIVEREVAAGRLVPVLPSYVALRASLYLLHRGSRLLPPKVRTFRDYMLKAFGVRTS